MNRKKVVLILLCFVFLAVFSSFASAETLGFGFVNAGDVALRKEPGGQKLIRLQKDECVWIKGSKTDGSGALWYNVSASYDDGGTARSRSGWMKAEFIDAGEKLWHDVSSVKAADYGMMVLRKDGTVDCVCETGNRDLRSWAAGLRDIRNISLSWLGWSFSALSGSGTFYSEGASETGIRVSPDYGYPYLITTDNRLMTGETTGFTWFWPQNVGTEQLSHVTAMTGNGYRLLLLTDDGRVYARVPRMTRSSTPNRTGKNGRTWPVLTQGSLPLRGPVRIITSSRRFGWTERCWPPRISWRCSSVPGRI